MESEAHQKGTRRFEAIHPKVQNRQHRPNPNGNSTGWAVMPAECSIPPKTQSPFLSLLVGK